MTAKYRLPGTSVKLGASTLMTILLLGLALPAAAFVASAGASAPLDTLQVTVQTTENLPFTYSLTAYNTSGYQVAYFSGNYGEAAFGLPSGTYLITASAYSQQGYCYPCPLGAGVNNTATPAEANGTAIPIRFETPEYGYSVVDLTGSSQITIVTRNSTQASLTNIPVHVEYVNGTAAVGAYVSAYVVGGNYLNSQDWVTYGQTGPDGNLTLVMPSAPIQVNAYLSIPILLPKNVSTIPVDVGGQKVNVTVYWQPDYVYLSGQALVLPPQMTASITLKVQQQPYPIYYGGPVTSGAVTTVTSTYNPSSGGQQVNGSSGTIAPFNPSNSQLSYSGPQAPGASLGLGMTWYLAAGGAVVLVAGALVVLLSRRKQVISARP
jgi:hypothetical protein